MDNLNKELRRKIRIRKVAIKNTGIDLHQESDHQDAENGYTQLLGQFDEAIDQAFESKEIVFYRPLVSNRKRIGCIINFLKRIIRKVYKISVGWIIFPMINRQSYYNGKIINAIKSERYMLELLENRLNNLETDYRDKNDKDLKLKEINNKLDYILCKMNISCDLELLKNNDIDYLKFENDYRGSRESVMAIQEQYLPYFINHKGGDIVDIGSGRGEFLELMESHSITAYGIDNYLPFVEYCQKRGYNVVMSDALTYINSLEDNSLGGVFMSQVVEHLSDDYIKALVKTVYKKLKPECYFIVETPNPECVAALTEFNIDMSHVKPIHYYALEFLFKEANYQSVEKYHAEQTLYPYSANPIEGEGIENIIKFNNGIGQINKLLFGYRDYTLIAKK